MTVRGVILAGGKGTRLGELTRVTNKHLLPVGAEPMVYHALRKLTGVGVREILMVSGPEHLGDFVRLFGSGRRHGCELTYRAQEEAGGIAQALGLARRFAGDERALVVLGDNIFFDPLHDFLAATAARPEHAWVLLKRVSDPRGLGVAEVQDGAIVAIEEKPEAPRSDLAVTGIYLYPPDVFEVIKALVPSQRREQEITDVNRHYLGQGRLSHRLLQGYWTDAGTPESLAVANRLVHAQPPSY